jgi:hypothetical protein
MLDGTTRPRHGTVPANGCVTADAPSYRRVEITVSQLFDSVFLFAPEVDSSPLATARTAVGALAVLRGFRARRSRSPRVGCGPIAP